MLLTIFIYSSQNPYIFRLLRHEILFVHKISMFLAFLKSSNFFSLLFIEYSANFLLLKYRLILIIKSKYLYTSHLLTLVII